MNIAEIKKTIRTPQYDFLKTNPHFGKRIILLGLGGSHAYGTEQNTSDLDVRGCAVNSKTEILTNDSFEQFVCEETDTTIYSFNKIIRLLSDCNPNTIELLEDMTVWQRNIKRSVRVINVR
ncbi:MAG: nucleotidyltransferase domain-containing protein [Lachnospiraceae bacterium]|nr:nucleotidyltransferase domain-containing protein [Lachnospiraceae bacterium]